MGFSKQCTKCGTVKWWYQFRASKQHKFSRNVWCICCMAEYNKKWIKNNPEKYKRRHKPEPDTKEYGLRVLREAAKEYAALNCLKYRDCLDAASMNRCGEFNCLGCEKADFMDGAYRREPDA